MRIKAVGRRDSRLCLLLARRESLLMSLIFFQCRFSPVNLFEFHTGPFLFQ